MSKYLLIIKGDTNDADYVTEESELTLAELEELKPVIERIKERLRLEKKDWNKYSTNWGTSDYCDKDESPEALYVDTGLLTQEQVWQFADYVPYGIHSIVSIRLLEVVQDITLLDRYGE